MEFKKKNKKAIFPAIDVGVAIVAAIIILMVLLFTAGILNFLKNNYIMLLGVLSFVGAVIFVIKSEGSTKFKTTVFFVLLTIGAIFVFSGGVLQEALTKQVYTGYIEVPTFGYYECAPSNSPGPGQWNNLPDSGRWFTCPADKTDQCDMQVSMGAGNWDWRKPYVEFEKCDIGGSCFGPKYHFFSSDTEIYSGDDLKNVGIDQKVWINTRRLTSVSTVFQVFQSLGANNVLTSLSGGANQEMSGGKVRSWYKPFILWKETQKEGRIPYTTQEQGCVFPNVDVKNLLDRSEVLFTLSKGQSSTRDDKLDPYKVRNFVEGFEPRSVENDAFVDWDGETGYCTNKQVYGIKEVETNEFIYKVVAFNEEFKLAPSGVTCCPGDPEPGKTCTDNFEWQTTTQVGCGLLSAGKSIDWEKFDSDTIEKFVCENNEWVQQTQEVECTTTSKCKELKGDEYFCDTLSWECVKGASLTTTTPHEDEEDGEDGEEKQCSSFEEFVDVTKTYRKGPFSIFGVGKKVTENFPDCKTKDIVKWVMFGIIILALGITAIFSSRPKRQSRRRGRRR